MVDLDAIKVVLSRLERGRMVSTALVKEASDQLKLAEEKFNSAASTPNQQLKAELAALVREYDAAGSQRYSLDNFDRVIDKLRQLSAV